MRIEKGLSPEETAQQAAQQTGLLLLNLGLSATAQKAGQQAGHIQTLHHVGGVGGQQGGGRIGVVGAQLLPQKAHQQGSDSGQNVAGFLAVDAGLLGDLVQRIAIVDTKQVGNDLAAVDEIHALQERGHVAGVLLTVIEQGVAKTGGGIGVLGLGLCTAEKQGQSCAQDAPGILTAGLGDLADAVETVVAHQRADQGIHIHSCSLHFK